MAASEAYFSLAECNDDGTTDRVYKALVVEDIEYYLSPTGNHLESVASFKDGGRTDY